MDDILINVNARTRFLVYSSLAGRGGTVCFSLFFSADGERPETFHTPLAYREMWPSEARGGY